jgi:hypothetical protein
MFENAFVERDSYEKASFAQGAERPLIHPVFCRFRIFDPFR